MAGIVAVAFLVACGTDLLVCEDLPARPDRFADMEACRAALPALIRHPKAQDSALPVLMGKCRLMIGSEMIPPAAGVLASSSR